MYAIYLPYVFESYLRLEISFMIAKKNREPKLPAYCVGKY
jgi:hypothetical protein